MNSVFSYEATALKFIFFAGIDIFAGLAYNNSSR